MANKKNRNPQALLPKGYGIYIKLMSAMKRKQTSVASSVQFQNEL